MSRTLIPPVSSSVVEEIVNARQALYGQMGSTPAATASKKTTVQNNMYGVDIMDSGIEITKLRLWLSIIAELQEDDLDSLSQTKISHSPTLCSTSVKGTA